MIYYGSAVCGYMVAVESSIGGNAGIYNAFFMGNRGTAANLKQAKKMDNVSLIYYDTSK